MLRRASWFIPALAVVASMLLAGAAMLYLNPDYLNASAPGSKEFAEGTGAASPLGETKACSGDCGDCSPIVGEDCGGDCPGNGLRDGSGRGKLSGGGCGGEGDCSSGGCVEGVVCDRSDAYKSLPSCASGGCSGCS